VLCPSNNCPDDAQSRSPSTDKKRSIDTALKFLVEDVAQYAVYMLDPEGSVATWNAGAERLNGYSQEEVLGKNFSMFFVPEDVEAGRPLEELAIAARDDRFGTEAWRQRKGGERFWVLVTLTAIRGSERELLGFVKVTRDISAQKALEDAQVLLALELSQRVKERTLQLETSVRQLRAKNEEIEALVATVSHDLSEKELLLREVYHRVKNNLQVVQSLLKMGARTVNSSDAQQAIETAVQRVRVMAMVHERLYQMPDLTRLTVSSYLRDVIEGAISSNSQEPSQIRLELDVDDISLPLDFAIPLGLLTNELVSNCIKHGDARGRTATISISAKVVPEAVRFIVQDDGAGLPENFDASKCKSMGIKLATSLARQLGGRLEFTSVNGCRVQADLTRLCSPREAPYLSDQSLTIAPAQFLDS
jgi:PAS domain S-box-containing protein